MRKKYGLIFTALTFVIPAVFTLYFISLKWPYWWKAVNFEKTYMTDMEAVILLLSALAGAAGFVISLKAGDRRDALSFFIVFLGFLYLGFDEKFAVHEFIRDHYLVQSGFKIPFITWTAPGDYILISFFLLGLITMPFLWNVIKKSRGSVIFSILAVLFAGTAIVIDSLDMEKAGNSLFRLEQFCEELCETTAMILFLNAFYYAVAAKISGLKADKNN